MNNTLLPPCPAGEFRDDLFYVPITTPPCQSWIPFAVCSALLLLLRYAMLVVNLVILLRVRSEQRKHVKKTTDRRKTIAWTPIVETLHTLFLSILLISAPWVNALQGLSWICMSLSLYWYFLGALLFTAKIVHTVRVAARTLIGPTASSPSGEKKGANLTVIWIILGIALHGFLLSWILGASAFPGSLDANKAAECFLAFLAVASMTFSAWENYSAYSLLRSYTKQTPFAVGEADSTHATRQARFERTVNKLWRSTVGLSILVAILVPFFGCIVFNVYHLYWGVVIAMMSIAAMASAVGLQTFLQGGKGTSQKHTDSSRRAREGNGGPMPGTLASHQTGSATDVKGSSPNLGMARSPVSGGGGGGGVESIHRGYSL